MSPQPYAVAPPAPPPLMDVAEVVRMVEAKVNDQVILRYAMKQRLKAAITADDLILLTGKGASWPLLCAIQEIPVAPPGDAKSRKTPSSKTSEPAVSERNGEGKMSTNTLHFGKENLRQMIDDWGRFWIFDRPDRSSP